MTLRIGIMVGACALLAVGACEDSKSKDDNKASETEKPAIDGGKADGDNKTPTSSNPAVVKMTNYAEILCGCKDAACARGVHTTYAAWISDFSAADAKMEKSDFDAWTAQQKRLLECWKKHKDETPLDLSKPDDVAKLITRITQDMCACKTADCAEAVENRAKKATKDVKPSIFLKVAGDMKKEFERFDKCKATARGEDDDKKGGSDEVENMNAFADDICKCKDMDCAKKVHKSFMAWVKKHFKGGKKKGSKANVEKWKKAQKKFNKCYIEVMKAGMNKPKPSGGDDIARHLSTYADDVCACRTSLCASNVIMKHGKWLRDHTKQLYGADAAKNRQLMRETTTRVSACLKQLRGK